MFSLRHLRDQLLHHHIEHGAGGEAQQIRQGRDHQASGQNGQRGAQRLHRAGEHAACKGAGLAHPLHPQGHGDDGPLGEVLDRDAQRQGQRPHHGDLAVSGQKTRVYHPDRHPLRDIVQGDRQHQHGRAPQPGAGSLRLPAPPVEVRDQVIQPQQKEDAAPKADDRRQEAPDSRAGGLLHGGDQQAPDGRGHHHAGGKAGEPPLHPIPQALVQEKDTGRAQRGARKREQQAINHGCLHRSPRKTVPPAEARPGPAKTRRRKSIRAARSFVLI